MKTLLTLALLTISIACSQQLPETADTIYTNGKIYTVNEAHPWAEAVAVNDGKFIKVGTTTDIESLAGDNTAVIDLEGKFMMPGIVDLHVHPFATPIFNAINLDFSDPTDPEVMIKDLKAYADAHPEKKWIRAGSWAAGVFPNNSPGKELLDEIIPDRPVACIDNTGHAYWVNSKALELAGIDKNTPTNSLYLIDKDPKTGEPTGTVRESSLRLIEQVAEQPTTEENYQAYLDVFEEFNSGGVTTMQTAEGNSNYMDIVKKIEEDGALNMRLYIGWDWHLHQTTPFTNEEMNQQIASRSQYASEMVSPNYVKIFLDGTPDGFAVPFIEPYSNDPTQYGTGKLTPEEIREAVINFDKQGVGTFMHSIGDASTRAALDAIEAAREVNGNTGVRHKVAHLTSIHPDDIPRFTSIPGVAAEMSPAVTYPTPAFESFIPAFGEDRYNRLFAAGSMIRAGAKLGYGSDWLTMIPPSPWKPMQGFVTRINPDMPELGKLGENENLTVEEVIKVFTWNGAYAVGAENEIGSIEVGKMADFIILNHNLLEIDPMEIKNTRVMSTVVGGKEVYTAK